MSEPLNAPDAISPEMYARLERRLSRERQARLEAEAIAEKGLRELWSGQRELTLLKSVARTANNARTARQALAETLRLVCEYTDWPLGHVYMPRARRRSRVVMPTDIWFGGEIPGFRAFRRASEAIEFGAGEGLPGRVLSSGKPEWSSPLHLDPSFPRGKLALEAGLASGLAFPVLIGADVAAVLEFFTPQTLEPDKQLLGVMAKVGDHLGRAIERERAQDRMTAKNRKLSLALKQVEAERRAAETANAAKSAFLAVTSHEVRTPLNAVLGLAEGLRREQLSARQASLVDGIVESGSMLLRLLNSVLELSKIESGQLALELSEFDVRALLGSVIMLWQGRARELRIDLRLDAEGLACSRWVRGDRGKLEQVATNLIANALKFTPVGGTVTVRASGNERAGALSLRLEVEDTGPGVPDEQKLAIFEPYSQTEAGRLAGGAGLGLTICAGHIRQMGGDIGVSDAPGGGAMFRVNLQLTTCEIERPVASHAEPEPAGLRILVAEDNEANRRVLQVLLEPVDVQLTFAENGLEALQAVQREAFDLVLMDANMPVMGGADAVRAIRTLSGPEAEIPIHMVTANAFEDDIRSYEAAGADGVLAKPVQVQQLYALISDVAAQASARSQWAILA